MEAQGEGLNQPVGSSPQKLERRIRDFESQGGVIIGGDSERETPTPEGNRMTTMEADPNNPPAHQDNEFLLSRLPEGPVTAENARKALEALAVIHVDNSLKKYISMIENSIKGASMTSSEGKQMIETAIHAREKFTEKLNIEHIITNLSQSDEPSLKALGLELQIVSEQIKNDRKRNGGKLEELEKTRESLKADNGEAIPGQINAAIEEIFGKQEEGDDRSLAQYAKDSFSLVFSDKTYREKLMNNLVKKGIISKKDRRKYNKLFNFKNEWKQLRSKIQESTILAGLAILALLAVAKQEEDEEKRR